MIVFDVIKENSKVKDDMYLDEIRRVFYNNLELSEFEAYSYDENMICDYIKKDEQIKVLCNLLLNTFVLKMNNDLNGKKFVEILKDYDLMIEFLKNRYELVSVKQYYKIG